MSAQNLTIHKTTLSGLLIIERPVFTDERGMFHEIFRLNELEDVGIGFQPIQWSHSCSYPKVIKGIHTEKWQKVVYPVTGKMVSFYVDTREDSDTFGKYEMVEFDNTNKESTHRAVYIPAGVGNSICVTGDEPVDYLYLTDEYWDNSKAQGIDIYDPDLKIPWPVKDPIISERDKNNPRMRDIFPDKYR